MTSSETMPLRLPLAGRVTVREIEDTYGRLSDALARHEAVVIDCAEVAEIDLSLIQLLLAAHRSAGPRLSLAAPLPRPLREALRRGGFLAEGPSPDPFWQLAA